LLLLNQIEEAASILQHRGEIQDAKTVKTLSIQGGIFTDPM
jgi:hypothetical protein